MHPVLFRFGGVTVYSYGVFVALALGVSFWMVGKNAVRAGLSHRIVNDLALVLFICGIAGARLFYVGQHWAEYRSDPWRLFFFQEGGLVWYGGFLAALAAGIFYSARRHWPILGLCDFFAPILALAQAIGRLGCFLNGCCYGRATDSRFGVLFTADPTRRLPVQLFESALLFFLSLLLFRISDNSSSGTKKRPGRVFFLYLFFYSGLRFCLEFLRGDQAIYIFLTIPQWTSLALFFGALFLFFKVGGGESADAKD